MKELRFNRDRMIIGPGALSAIEALEGRRFFVVSGKGSMVKNGTIGRIKEMLKKKTRLTIFIWASAATRRWRKWKRERRG